jgi:ATP-dependent RNA helicase RhlE
LLNKGVDIIVATPGRLLDLINQKLCSLEEIKYFVLDEADRMLDMGFIRDVEKIVNLLPKKRQSLFFSATMPKTVAKLADNILKNPKKVKVKSTVTPIDRISQSVIVIEPQEKISQLVTLLNDNLLKSVIVFIKTKHKANRVCQKLTQIGIVTDVIHSNKSQSARQKALNDFKEGKIKILLATDIAARGIDVEAISHIINFDMPSTPEDYVHRIGRTARAGANGIAISLCEPSERLKLFRIEELINIKLNVIKSERSKLELIENFSENNQNSNKSEVRNANFSKIKKIKSLKVVAKKTKSIIKRNAKKDKLKSKKKKVERKING